MVTLPMLINDLEPHILSIDDHQKVFREFRGIYLIEGTTAMEEDMIYVGTCEMAAQLLIHGTLVENCVIFSAGDNKALHNAPGQGVILITAQLSLISLYNQLMRTFLLCENWQTLLCKDSHKGIKSLLQAATKHFDISILLLSPEQIPICRSTQNHEEELLNSYNTDSPLRHLLKQLANDNPCSSATIERENGYIYTLTPINQGHTILGYLYACANGSREKLQNILYAMVPMAARFLLDDEWHTQHKNSFQTLAAQFLGDNPDDLENLEMQLKHLPNKPKRFMRGIIIRQIDDDGHPAPIYPQNLRQLFNDIQNLFPLDNAAILNECVYVMTSDEKPDSPITITENQEFELLLQKHNAYAMVSNPSQRLHGVRVLFRQCFQILPAAVSIRFQDESERRCLRFDRYSPYYIIHLCEQSAAREMGSNDVLYLCHPAVITLTRYDRAYNSNLRNTLFTYLMNDRSISETSRKMFMHRNTTIYKLNKIQELINDNLDNPYTRHQLILSCMIIRYVEQYQHSSFNLPPLESSLLRK